MLHLTKMRSESLNSKLVLKSQKKYVRLKVTMLENSQSTKPSLLSSEQIAAFERDGYLVLSNLFDDETLQQVVSTGEALTRTAVPGTYFSTIEKGAMYTKEAFRSLAIRSELPQIAAELMQLNPTTQNVRILRYDSVITIAARQCNSQYHLTLFSTTTIETSSWPNMFRTTILADSMWMIRGFGPRVT